MVVCSVICNLRSPLKTGSLNGANGGASNGANGASGASGAGGTNGAGLGGLPSGLPALMDRPGTAPAQARR